MTGAGNGASDMAAELLKAQGVRNELQSAPQAHSDADNAVVIPDSDDERIDESTNGEKSDKKTGEKKAPAASKRTASRRIAGGGKDDASNADPIASTASSSTGSRPVRLTRGMKATAGTTASNAATRRKEPNVPRTEPQTAHNPNSRADDPAPAEDTDGENTGLATQQLTPKAQIPGHKRKHTEEPDGRNKSAKNICTDVAFYEPSSYNSGQSDVTDQVMMLYQWQLSNAVLRHVSLDEDKSIKFEIGGQWRLTVDGDLALSGEIATAWTLTISGPYYFARNGSTIHMRFNESPSLSPAIASF